MVRMWLKHFLYLYIYIYIYIQQKLLILCLSVEASIHVARYVQFYSVYISAKWIGSLYL